MNKEELKKKAILGTLKGVCADFIVPTRNGRKYTSKLWKKVFQSELVKEQFENGGIFGELSHPVDRDETLPEKIAICMPKPPVENNKGQLEATFDILDTPNGRILKTLVDYGYKIGISSRGTGELLEDAEGNEIVDEDTYDFKAFDAVLIPAVKSARLSVVESLNDKTFKQSLRECLEKSSDDDKEIMKQTLDNLGIKVEDKDDHSPEVVEDKIEEVCDECKEEIKEEKACDTGLNEIVSSLQESLKKNSELENKIQELQNQLAVSDTKVMSISEELIKYKSATARLTTNFSKKEKDYSNQISSLKEELMKQKSLIVEKDSKIKELNESKELELSENKKSLTESLSNKDLEIKKLQESLSKVETNSKNEIKKLTEQLEDVKADSLLKNKEFEKKINESSNKIKLYKKTINETVSRYINSKAKMIGVSSNRIINELSDSYTIDDIDKVCESLQQEVININKLPFNIITENAKIKVTGSKNDLIPDNSEIFGDDIDDGLIRLAKLK